MFIDTHCHLNFKAFENNLDSFLERARKANVGKIVIPGAKIDSSGKAVEIAEKYQNCFAAVGIHPHHALDSHTEFDSASKNGFRVKPGMTTTERIQDDKTSLKDELTSLASNPKVCAIGEIGMDYHHYKNSPPPDEETKKIQKELFLLQLEIAYEKKLPVIIHCRWAQTDVFNIISEFIKIKPLNGVFHCFDGSREYLKNVLNLGFFAGFDGNSTYPENNHLRELMSFTPLDRLLLETDSPFLTPIPYRGNLNEPAYLIHVAGTVSAIHKKSLKEVEEITYSNGTKLFQI